MAIVDKTGNLSVSFPERMQQHLEIRNSSILHMDFYSPDGHHSPYVPAFQSKTTILMSCLFVLEMPLFPSSVHPRGFKYLNKKNVFLLYSELIFFWKRCHPPPIAIPRTVWALLRTISRRTADSLHVSMHEALSSEQHIENKLPV